MAYDFDAAFVALAQFVRCTYNVDLGRGVDLGKRQTYINVVCGDCGSVKHEILKHTVRMNEKSMDRVYEILQCFLTSGCMCRRGEEEPELIRVIR